MSHRGNNLRRGGHGGRARRDIQLEWVKEQLEGIGRRPLPPPRPGFAEGLLARILAEGSVPAGGAGLVVVPLAPYRRRRSAVAAKAAVAAAVAAVCVALVGVVSLVDSASSPARTTPAQLASGLGVTSEVTVGRDGVLLGGSGQPLALEDGPAVLTCSDEMTFADRSGQAYRCLAGEAVSITIENNAVAWSSATPTQAELIPLQLQEPARTLPLAWQWERFEGPAPWFFGYELVRGQSDEPALASPADPGDPTEVVVSVTGIDQTNFTETTVLDHSATYQIRVIGPGGRVVALSNTVRVRVSDR